MMKLCKNGGERKYYGAAGREDQVKDKMIYNKQCRLLCIIDTLLCL